MSRSPAVYVYGLVRAELELDLGPIGIHEDDRPTDVDTLRAGRIAALVSIHRDRSTVLPARCNLDAHQRVIARTLEAGTILPFAFGQLAQNERAVLRFLRDHEPAVCEELDRLDGKVQMALNVRWEVENIFQYIIEDDCELANFRDRLFASSDPPSFDDRIHLGQRFERCLQTRKRSISQALAASLGVSRMAPKELPVRSEKSVAHLVFLIDRATCARFEDDVRHLAADWPPEYVFRVTGPWAPFDFVELQFQEDPT
jgi:gas vesicle protein GvpL/GvpF